MRGLLPEPSLDNTMGEMVVNMIVATLFAVGFLVSTKCLFMVVTDVFSIKIIQKSAYELEDDLAALKNEKNDEARRDSAQRMSELRQSAEENMNGVAPNGNKVAQAGSPSDAATFTENEVTAMRAALIREKLKAIDKVRKILHFAFLSQIATQVLMDLLRSISKQPDWHFICQITFMFITTLQSIWIIMFLNSWDEK